MALIGCTVGPDYRRPQLDAPAAYVEDTGTSTTLTPAPMPAPAPADGRLARWWELFQDPTLDHLIEHALAHNLDLESAVSRVRESRLKEREAGAAGYPSVSALGSAVDLRTNAAPGASALPIPSRLNLYTAGFDASWELDLFGATRRTVEEAKSGTQAVLWDERDGEVSLTAEIANDYFSLRALQARIAVGGAELARQNDLFLLIQARRSAGFVTRLDVNQQQTLVATAAAQIPQLEAEARARIHALGLLIGEPPEYLESELRGSGGALPLPPPELPSGLPARLLLRRPDVRAAESRLAAKNAQVGVKTASLYPKVDLLGLAAFSGASDLFSSGNLLAAALGMISEPLFDAGANRARLDQAKEERTQAELAYRTAFLGALRDVEDALARHRYEEHRRESLVLAVSAAQGTLGIAEDRYETGFVTFVDVLQAQYVLLNAKDLLTQSDALVVTDLVAIYKALGGGWSGAD